MIQTSLSHRSFQFCRYRKLGNLGINNARIAMNITFRTSLFILSFLNFLYLLFLSLFLDDLDASSILNILNFRIFQIFSTMFMLDVLGFLLFPSLNINRINGTDNTDIIRTTCIMFLVFVTTTIRIKVNDISQSSTTSKTRTSRASTTLGIAGRSLRNVVIQVILQIWHLDLALVQEVQA